MKRQSLIFTIIALFLFLLGMRVGVAAQTSVPAFQHLPVVRNGAAQPVDTTICDGSAPLLNRDTGSLTATRDADGRYIVAYQDRQAGSKSFIMQHVGAELVDFGAPVLADTQAVPRLSPDGPKQGSLALVPSAMPGGKSRLYYTQREQDDTPNEGPYGIWCMEF